MTTKSKPENKDKAKPAGNANKGKKPPKLNIRVDSKHVGHKG